MAVTFLNTKHVDPYFEQIRLSNPYKVCLRHKKKASRGPPQANWCTLHTYIWKCIFSSSSTKRIHGECITSEKNTVWKHPCYLTLSTKPLPIICFRVARSPFFSRFFPFFSKTSKIHSSGVNGMDDSLPSFHLLKDPLACKPRREGPMRGLSGMAGHSYHQAA